VTPFGGDVHPGRMAACSRLHLPVISPSVTVRDTSTHQIGDTTIADPKADPEQFLLSCFQ
jgi:hypothetical protein